MVHVFSFPVLQTLIPHSSLPEFEPYAQLHGSYHLLEPKPHLYLVNLVLKGQSMSMPILLMMPKCFGSDLI